MPFEVGQTVSDYEILQMLGRGGMGCVYRVRNIISHRVEAMKVLLDDLSTDPELADRFMAEIRTLARLDHPNIAKLHTAFTANNQLVMIMELLEGTTLAERIKQGPIPLDQAIDFTSQTLSALSYAHQAGVIHRDVKPSNVMITPHGIAKLMDFGIAKSDADPNQTRTGTTMGSMLYMSPEQVRGSSVDARSDIYSVGIMFYELASGKRPFDGENTHAILDAQLNQMPAPIVNPALPAAINDIISTAMAKDPMHRFQSAEAFRKAVESLAPKPATAAAAGAVAGANSAPKSNRGLWMALGAVTCVCVLIGGAITLPRFFGSHAAPKPVPGISATLTPLPAAQSEKTPQSPEPTPQAVSVIPSATPDVSPVSKTVSHPVPSNVVPEVAQPMVKQSPPEQAPAASPLPQQPPPQTQAQAPAGPTPEQLEAANDELIKLHARADAIRTSLDHLRSEQAAAGLNLNPTVTSGVSRMDNYLRAADQALQSNNLESAQKSIDRANTEISKLESFFGR